MKKIYLVILLGFLLGPMMGWGQISMTSLPASYTNNFDSYWPVTSVANSLATIHSTGTGTGLANAATGWTFNNPSGNLNQRGTGTGSTAGVIAYGITPGSEYSLGTFRTSTNEISYTVSFTNNTGFTINSLTLAWDYEQWRYANISGINVTGTGALASNTTLNSKDFLGSVTGTNGVSTTTTVPYFVLTGLSIANGASFGITWITTDATGNDNGLSIDNFYIYAGPTTILAPYTTQLSGNISRGATTEPISGFTITNSESSDFTSLTVTGGGTAAATDVTNIRVFRDNNGNGLIDGADAAVSTNTFATFTTPMAFTFTSETGFTGIRNYVIVGDIATTTVGTNVQVGIASPAAFTTTAANKIGSMATVTRTFATPSVVINSLGPVAGSIGAGVDNNIIYSFSAAVTVSNAYVTSVTLPVTFTSAGDFKASGFKLWYRASINSLGGATQLLPSVDESGGNLTFTLTSNQVIAPGITGYFWVTADVASGANAGNTIIGNALPLANVLYSTSVSASGTPNVGGLQTIIVLSYAAFDNFTRTDNATLGIPSSGGTVAWTETESSGGTSRASIFSNQLRLSTSNTPAVGGNNTTGREFVSFDMSSKYSTQFNTSAGTLDWYFNIKQTRSGPSGFSGTTYGAAFVLGCTQADFTSGTANGYAVIIGNSGSPDAVKLIYFTGGLVGVYAAGPANDIAVSTETGETPYYSVRVTYNPCTNLWSLQVRNDGGTAFTDPVAGTYINPPVTAVNSTHVSSDLKFLGTLWNHQGGVSGSDDAYFDNISIPSSAAIGATYTWNGATTDYQVATNWIPNRICPRVTDKLQFNTLNTAYIVTNVPVQTIGQLLITNNCSVTLRDVSADALASTLTIGGLTGIDFSVAAGSSLALDVAASNAVGDAMLISLASAATGSIAGTVNFFNSIDGVARSHRILASTASSIVVTGTGIVKAIDLNGNPFGSAGTANIITFNSGAIYEFNDGSNPFGLTQPASKVVFNTGSIYKHKLSSSAPSLPGRTYGDFEFDVTSGTTTVTTGSASPVCTMDNLKVISGTFLINCSFNFLPVNINLKKDLLISSGAAFSYSPIAATATSTLTFNASAVQQVINNAVGGTLTFNQYSIVKLDNSFATAPQLTVQSNIDINGALDITLGRIDLAPGNITIRSTPSYTARVAPVAGSITYGTGKFIIERYLPIPLTAAARRWRLLTAPIQTTGAPNINTAWQEGQANANRLSPSDTKPGFGTIITKSIIAASGYDQGATNNASIFKFEGSNIIPWQTIAATNTGAITDQEGYMIFVRGSRDFIVAGAGVAGAPTTLRSTGLINTGNVSKLLDPLYPKLIGNPYPSAISFNKVTVNGQNPATTSGITFYLWDPKYAGLSNVGGIITFTSLGTGFYTVAPNAIGSNYTTGIYDGTIESGAAFLMPASAGSIDFTEASKIQTSSTQGIASRPSGPQEPVQKTAFFTTNLLACNAADAVLIDGVVNVCRDDFENKADDKDGPKLITFQIAEKLTLLRDEKLLGIELRKSFEHNDSIVYQISKMKQANYQLAFIQTGFTNDLKAIAEDKFTGKKLLLSSSDTSLLAFTITDNPASAAADRFKVVFKSAVKFNAIKATGINADVQVEWDLENEFDADRYEVERSLDGNSFTTVGSIVSKGNSMDAIAYSTLDNKPAPGIYYYRIKGISNNGAIGYSETVKVVMMNLKGSLYVYPNPVSDGTIGLQMNSTPAGVYSLRLLNSAGQSIVAKTVNHTGGTGSVNINYPAQLTGHYQLEITGANKKKTVLKVVIQ